MIVMNCVHLLNSSDIADRSRVILSTDTALGWLPTLDVIYALTDPADLPEGGLLGSADGAPTRFAMAWQQCNNHRGLVKANLADSGVQKCCQ